VGHQSTEKEALWMRPHGLEAARLKRINARAKNKRDDDRAYVAELDEEPLKPEEDSEEIAV